jgi:hypothetical protein
MRTYVRIRSKRGRAIVNKTRLTPLGRLLALVAIITFGAVAGAAGAAASKPHARAWRCVAVRPGDTLWGFAGTVEKTDPRDAVQRIVDENGLTGGDVPVGMALWVPNSGDVSSLLAADPKLCRPAE